MDRAQIHTLEAAIAALLIVGALLFASQATAVTPLSASTSNQHIENQQLTMGEDVLAMADRNGSLQAALTYWNLSEGDDPPHFRGADPNQTAYSTFYGEDNPLNESIHGAFGHGIYAYNIELRYLTEEGEFRTVDMVRMGSPSDHAVTATRTVTLFDDDELPDQQGKLADDSVESEFWAPNIDENSSVYNVVEVRLTLWRM